MVRSGTSWPKSERPIHAGLTVLRTGDRARSFLDSVRSPRHINPFTARNICMELRILGAALLLTAALSGCIGGDEDLGLDEHAAEQFLTVYVQSDLGAEREVKIDVLDHGELVISKVYHAPADRLHREPVVSTMVGLDGFTLDIHVDDERLDRVTADDAACALGEGIVDLELTDDFAKTRYRCV